MTEQLAHQQGGLAQVDALIGSLRMALTGTPSEGLASHVHLRNPLVSASFGPGSTTLPVDVGAGLWAVLRTSADGADRVLCVHNASDQPRAFSPSPHLLDDVDVLAPLVFLHGETTTGTGADGLECELRAHSFVWLGRFTTSSGDVTP